MTPEENEDWLYLKSKMDNEGFHYCFVHYSRFEEIKDKKFHELKNLYINTAKELEDYINNKCKEDLDDE